MMRTNETNQTKRVIAYLAGAIIFIAAIVTTLYLSGAFAREKEETVRQATPIESSSLDSTTIEAQPVKIEQSALLTVPYTVQAPEQSWNIHEESCEEAALLMYYYFLIGKKFKSDQIPAELAKTEMIKMKSWQKKEYGKEPDLTIVGLGKFAQSYYGLTPTVTKSTTALNIKKAISSGSPVLVPVMTHSLKNPNYGREDTYHILLIKGYNKKGVITNDAGISKGKDYFYTWDILFSAIDAQKSKMKQGREMIIFTD